jgi:hypothetical protein
MFIVQNDWWFFFSTFLNRANPRSIHFLAKKQPETFRIPAVSC